MPAPMTRHIREPGARVRQTSRSPAGQGSSRGGSFAPVPGRPVKDDYFVQSCSVRLTKRSSDDGFVTRTGAMREGRTRRRNMNRQVAALAFALCLTSTYAAAQTTYTLKETVDVHQ